MCLGLCLMEQSHLAASLDLECQERHPDGAFLHQIYSGWIVLRWFVYRIEELYQGGIPLKANILGQPLPHLETVVDLVNSTDSGRQAGPWIKRDHTVSSLSPYTLIRI